jgi:hypothetical protein
MTVSDPTLDMDAFLVTRWEGESVNAAPRSTTIFAGSGPAISQTQDGPPGQPVEHPERRPGRNRLAVTNRPLVGTSGWTPAPTRGGMHIASARIVTSP